MEFSMANISNYSSNALNEDLAMEAYTCVLNPIKCINTAFRYFAALNLINAYVKIDTADMDFKKKYNFKHYVSMGIEQVIARKILGIELYITKQVVYIRFNEIQFSFHNITLSPIIKTFMASDKNHRQEWTEIRLQPIADKLYTHAKNLNNGTPKK